MKELTDYPPASDEEMAWLLKQAQDKDLGIRAVALMALGQTKDKRAVEPLLGALKDQDQSVQLSAATGLVHLRDPRIVEALKPLPLDYLIASGATAALIAQGDAGVDALLRR